MSKPLLPYDRWLSGTNENSLPANDNSLRDEIFNSSAVSQVVTAQPSFTSPADDGKWYIIPAGATGSQWGGFSADSAAIFYGGTWYEFTPVLNAIVTIAGSFYRYEGSNGWDAIGAGVTSKFINVALSDMTTSITTGTNKAIWFAPEDGTLIDLWIGVLGQSSSGVVRIDLNKNGSTVLSTRPAIDAGETSSLTGTSAVISTPSFSKGDLFSFDIDDAGTSAEGLQAVIEYQP